MRPSDSSKIFNVALRRKKFAHPQSRSPCSPLPRLFGDVSVTLCWSINEVPTSGGSSAGDQPVIALPVRAPAGDPTPIMPVKGTYSAKSRVSIETRELRQSTREYDFPGSNIPNQYPSQRWSWVGLTHGLGWVQKLDGWHGLGWVDTGKLPIIARNNWLQCIAIWIVNHRRINFFIVNTQYKH